MHEGDEPDALAHLSNLIAHIEHDGLMFSISIDDRDDKSLSVVIPEKSASFATSSRPSVRLRVLMADDSIIEGAAKTNPPWVGNAGSAAVAYQFGLGRRASVDDIHSVTIWIADQRYEVYPF